MITLSEHVKPIRALMSAAQVVLAAGLFAGLVLIVLAPRGVFAESFSSFPIVKKVDLQANVYVDEKPVKPPFVVKSASDFTVVWKSGGVGCVSNWSDAALPANGSTVGSITKNRVFVITCFGRGAAQTMSLPVTVGIVDLAVNSFTAPGLRAAKGKKGVYLTDPDNEEKKAPFTLKASIKNLGKLPVAVPFKVKYSESEDGTSGWVSIGERTVAGIGSGAALAVEELPRLGNPNGEKRYYRACVDTEEEVEESKEDNNCSKVLGPYSFILAP